MNKHLLNKAIKKAGSITRLAKEYGCTHNFISNIKRGCPAGDKFVKFCEAYIKDDYDADRKDIKALGKR